MWPQQKSLPFIYYYDCPIFVWFHPLYLIVSSLSAIQYFSLFVCFLYSSSKCLLSSYYNKVVVAEGDEGEKYLFQRNLIGYKLQ